MTTKRWRGLAAATAAMLAMTGPACAATAKTPRLVVDHVVILMRHGVRPPTKAPPIPADRAAQPWPDWSVPPGWLTPHGAAALRPIALVDRATLRGEAMLPETGCPKDGDVAVIADSDERTIATAKVWLDTVAPGCGIKNQHRTQGVFDPIFSSLGYDLTLYEPKVGDAAVRAATGPGGFAALDRRYRPLLDRLDRILCGKHPAPDCGVAHKPTGLRDEKNGKPKLTGTLDRASTAAQSLLLEYADAKPMREVGWGRATAKDIAALSAFHALEFRLVARPRPVAIENIVEMANVIRRGLNGEATVTMLSGHDTNIANLAGLLGAHWHVPGLAADDPAPGGAIVLTDVHDRAGRHFVRATYRSQTIEQIRDARPVTPTTIYRKALRIKGCVDARPDGLCPRASFLKLIGAT